MVYKKDYKSIVGTFKIKGQEDHTFCPEKEKTFEKSVDFALEASFKDFNFRTLTTKKVDGKTRLSCLMKEDPEAPKNDTTTAFLMRCLKKADFHKRFIEYFKKDIDETSFDRWHHETCTLFLDTIRDLEIYESIAYGKAQKIVNMMFKHLYCLDGAEKYEEHFRHCHLTLDNFTLEWFKRNTGKARIDSWSNLTYNKDAEQVAKEAAEKEKGQAVEQAKEQAAEQVIEAAEAKKAAQNAVIEAEEKSNAASKEGKKEAQRKLKEAEEALKKAEKNEKEAEKAAVTAYKFYQTVIRKKWKEADNPYNNLTPFQAEFYIWPEIQLHMAAEGLFSQGIGEEEACSLLETIAKEEVKAFKNDKPKKYRTDANGTGTLETIDFDDAKTIFKKLPLEKKMPILREVVDRYDKVIQSNLSIGIPYEMPEAIRKRFSGVLPIFEEIKDECTQLWSEQNPDGCPKEFVVDYKEVEEILTLALSEEQNDSSADKERTDKTKRCFAVEYVQSEDSADKSENGQGSTAVFESEGCFYSLVADGVGNDEKATLSSRICTMLLEKLLTKEISAETVLRLCDAFVRANGLASTIDLMELNLVSGRAHVYKCGAAPSYVKREENFFGLRAKTFPSGEGSAFDCEKISFNVETGDLIVMLSKDVVQRFEENLSTLDTPSFSWRKESDFRAMVDENLKELGLSDRKGITVIHIREAST